MFNVLIADDEESIREGLMQIIDWEKYECQICGQAKNGEEAFKLIKELSPDLVLLDIKMPKMTGLDTLKAVKNDAELQNKKPHFLILSGFSDFTFAKEAMNYGAQGYLLKPVDEEELEERVSQIVNELKTQNTEEDLNKKFEKMFLSNSVKNAFEKPSEHDGKYSVILFDSKRANLSQKISDFNKSIKIAFTGLKPITFIHNDDIIAIFKDCKRSTILQTTEHFCKRNVASPFVVVGPELLNLEGALESFTTCYQDKDKLFFTPDFEYFLCTEDSNNNEENPSDFSPLLEKLVQDAVFCIETYDKAHLQELFETFLSDFNTKKGFYKSENVKTKCVSFVIELQSALSKKYPERNFPKESAYALVPQILAQNRFVNAFNIVKTFAFDFLENFHTNTANSTIVKVIQYVKTNFAEDLKLENLGERFYCNAAYLGKRFREETGMQFNAYLDKIRINEAKKKLETTDLKVYEISKIVGYSNTDYFFMKFRKATGMTPKEYKQQLSKQEN